MGSQCEINEIATPKEPGTPPTDVGRPVHHTDTCRIYPEFETPSTHHTNQVTNGDVLTPGHFLNGRPL